MYLVYRPVFSYLLGFGWLKLGVWSIWLVALFLFFQKIFKILEISRFPKLAGRRRGDTPPPFSTNAARAGFVCTCGLEQPKALPLGGPVTLIISVFPGGGSRGQKPLFWADFPITRPLGVWNLSCRKWASNEDLRWKGQKEGSKPPPHPPPGFANFGVKNAQIWHILAPGQNRGVFSAKNSKFRHNSNLNEDKFIQHTMPGCVKMFFQKTIWDIFLQENHFELRWRNNYPTGRCNTWSTRVHFT